MDCSLIVKPSVSIVATSAKRTGTQPRHTLRPMAKPKLLTKGRWAEELQNVLWAYRTTPQRSTGETPYSLAYGVEAVILVKISLCSMRTLDFSPIMNEESMVRQFDSLEECQEEAMIHLANYQQKLA